MSSSRSHTNETGHSQTTKTTASTSIKEDPTEANSNQPDESTSVSGSVDSLFDGNGQLRPADEAENDTSEFTFTQHQTDDIGRDVAEDVDEDDQKHFRNSDQQVGERTPEYE